VLRTSDSEILEIADLGAWNFGRLWALRFSLWKKPLSDADQRAAFSRGSHHAHSRTKTMPSPL